jgi:hypothetical protein
MGLGYNPKERKLKKNIQSLVSNQLMLNDEIEKTN